MAESGTHAGAESGDRDSGQAPLTVAFDGSGSTDPEGATLPTRICTSRGTHVLGPKTTRRTARKYA